MTDLTLPTDKMLARTEGAIGHIIFNNPERHNAVSLEMWDAVDVALTAFAEDDAVRIVVLSGAGGKAFVSGADISKFESERGSKEATEHYNTRLKVVYDAIETYAKPTIAMINGHCIGGGLNLAACCDMRLASTKSRFAMPAAKLALGYPFDAIRRLVNAVGVAAAKQLMFTAKSIDAETALRLGFVQEVVEEDALEGRVAELAGQIAGNAPLTVRAMKFIATQVMQADPAKRELDRCDAMVAACFASEDYVEGRRAFMEKRKPDFKGK
ncbi:MAG: enoyl-CoA hydratase [Pseudomonadota bacterium]